MLLKGGKNVSSLLRNSFTGDDDLNDSEAVASIMQHFRLDPARSVLSVPFSFFVRDLFYS